MRPRSRSRRRSFAARCPALVFVVASACGDAADTDPEVGSTGVGTSAPSDSSADVPADASSDPSGGSSGDASASASATSGDSTGDTGPVVSGGCFGPGEVPGTIGPAGFAMPSLDDERATYERWGLTWSPDAEPSYAADPGFTMTDPDIHGSTEGDDLWTSLMMHERTGQGGYLDRALAWRRYFVEDYRSCVGGEGANFCYDVDAFGGDHLWGWGMLAWSQAQDDPDALAEAERLGDLLETLWAPDSPYGCIPTAGCIHYGVRLVGRHLLLATRLSELSDDPRWAVLRDAIIDRLLASPEWDAERGMYFLGDWSTDENLGAGAWAGGARILSPFMLGVLGEGMDHAYRVTGNEVLRERLVAMAAFADTYGLDPEYQYTGSTFGIVDGEVWHSYSAGETVDFWDPVYTTSLVNTLVRGWRYTCDPKYYERARFFFERGNRGIYGEPVEQSVPDGQVDHFVDTRFDTSSGSQFYGYNKGELQYTYLLFDPEAP